MSAIRHAKIEVPRRRRGLPVDDQLLPLIGNAPQTVFIKVDANDQVSFSLAQGPSFPGGISWECSGYALMITFVFVNTDPKNKISELIQITPVFWFSDTFSSPPSSSHLQQACCVASAPGEYHFNVIVETILDDDTTTTRRLDIDPRIVVTPITA
jgi:hypothetical protein